MRPATLRRLLVFGVCALGVGALYLIPSFDPATSRSAGNQADLEPASGQPPIAYDGRAQLVGAWQVGTGGFGSWPARDRQPADDEAPSTVSELTFPTVTAERLTVRWPAASDNVGVATYRIWLNGYHVADTPALEVVIPWFRDGSRVQVVQVRAVDAAGNQSRQAPAQLVERPARELGLSGGVG